MGAGESLISSDECLMTHVCSAESLLMQFSVILFALRELIEWTKTLVENKAYGSSNRSHKAN